MPRYEVTVTAERVEEECFYYEVQAIDVAAAIDTAHLAHAECQPGWDPVDYDVDFIDEDDYLVDDFTDEVPEEQFTGIGYQVLPFTAEAELAEAAAVVATPAVSVIIRQEPVTTDAWTRSQQPR